MSERRIGNVISVDSFRVIIKLDQDMKSLYKSGYEDIYEVARINSYIIIPIGADRIVAIVTRVKAVDETELSSDKEAIFLTQSARYLVATMIGTIENSGNYIQGVYNYPILDNPVWFITKDDLDKIFDQKEKAVLNYCEDFFLPIGTSPSFADYRIKINPDKFFGKHAAILGNTGSGKSCTVASIIQSLFEYKYDGKNLRSAHFVIFDTNGEYKNAFISHDKTINGKSTHVEYAKEKEVRPFPINQDGMKVPFWFMNFDNFDYLFDPSANTQTPILKRAISIAKEANNTRVIGLLPRPYLSFFYNLLQQCNENTWAIRKTIYKELKPFCDDLHVLSCNYDLTEFKSILKALYNEKKNLTESKTFIEGVLSTKVLTEVSDRLTEELANYNAFANGKIINEERNIDLPVWFDFDKLIKEDLDLAIDEMDSSSNKLREFISTLRLRLQAYANDERIAGPLMLKEAKAIDEALAKFLAFILGDFCKVHQTGSDDVFSKYYKQYKPSSENDAKAVNVSQLTIIDMSLLSFEVLETITGLIGRLILEFLSRFSADERGKAPVVIVLEEAQNYIPEKNAKEKISIAKRVFERIAREGRKYGLSLIVSSQRPSELSKTVLSQCNSFVIHRLQNPEDQKYIRQLVSAANEDILQQLPILPQQHAIILGDAVRTPVQIKMNNANPRPNSDNPEFVNNWLQEPRPGFPRYQEIATVWENGSNGK